MPRTTSILARVILAALVYSTVIGRLWAEPTEKEPKKDPPGPPAFLTAKPLEITRGDDEMRKLIKRLYNYRQVLTLEHYKAYRGYNEHRCDVLLESSRRLLRAGLDIYEKPDERVEFLKHMEELADKVTTIMVDRPRIAPLDREKWGEFKIELEIEILKAKKAAAKQGDR
jgi:hypothetical protein